MEVLHTHTQTLFRHNLGIVQAAFLSHFDDDREKASEKEMHHRTVSFCVFCGFWIFLSVL